MNDGYEARHQDPTTTRSDGQDGRAWDGWATGNTDDTKRGRWLYEGALS